MNGNKKTYYDKEQDIFWVVYKEGEQDRYEEITPGVNVEYNAKNEVIGVEYLNFSR